MRPIDKRGWPVEFFKNRPVLNFIRMLLHMDIIKTIAYRNKSTYGWKYEDTLDEQQPIPSEAANE